MNPEIDEEKIGLGDDVDNLQTILDNHLKNKEYDDMTSAQLINDILEDVMELLHKSNKPYKFIANLMLSQRIGTGLTNISSCYWDKTFDFVHHTFYPKDKSFTISGKERPMIFGLLTVFGISYTSMENKLY